MATNPSLNSLNFLVYGAGAIGTYVGGSLVLAGHHATFLERPHTVKELQARGLRLDLSIDPRRESKDALLIEPRWFLAASSLPEALRHGPFDAAIFALKSFDTAAALDEMRPLADRMPPIFCLSNGVDNEPALAGLLGADKVIFGVISTAVARRAAGDIALEKLRGLGIASGHRLSQHLFKVLDAAGLRARLYPDAQNMKWSKLFTNLIANPASAILNMSAAQIFSHRELYAVEIDMLREGLAVMKAMGLQVVDPPAVEARALAFATKLPLWLSRLLVARSVGVGRGGKMPSFHVDLYSDRGKSEVEFLHGAVVRYGKTVGVSTPVNAALTKILTALTRKELPRDRYTGHPKEYLAAVRSEQAA